MRIDLTRSVPFTVTRADDGGEGDGLTLEGYAAVFGQWTRIDSWEGMFDEQFAAGSFKKTLRERTPLMQYDHGRHPLVGSIPIGRYDSLTEDTRGLNVRGRLSDNWLIEPVRDAIRDGGVTGMSIRFAVVRDEWRDAAGKIVKPDELMELLWMPGDRGPLQRTIKEAQLLEAGPVAWPAYDGTSVGVRARSAADELLGDEDRKRAVRQSLYASTPVGPDLDGVDPHELAVALLSAGQDRSPESTQTESPESSAPPPPEGEGHPDDSAAAAATRDTDPPPLGAPVGAPIDAPPATGHPSAEHAERRRVARLAYVTLRSVGKQT